MQIDALEYAHRCGPLSEQPREAEPYWTPECKPANELDEEVYYSEHEWVSWYSTLDEAGIAAVGFQAKGKGKGRTQWTPAQMKQYENDECFVCGKGGHKARDCPDVKETKGKGKKGEKGKGKGKGGKGKGNYWRKGAGALDAEMPEAEGLTGGEDGGGRGCGGLACGSLELLGEFDIGMVQEVSNSPSNTGSEPDIDADSNFADQIETQNMINDRLNEAESSEDDDDGESDGNDEDRAITMTGAKFFDFTTTSSPKRYRAIDPEPSQSSADVKAGRQAASAGDPISLGATFAAAADLAAEAAHDRAETGLGAAFAAAAAKSVATAAAHESVAGQTSDLGESRVEPVDVSPGTDQASSLGEALGFSRRPVVVANHESESAPSRVANHRSGPSLSDAFLIEQKKFGLVAVHFDLTEQDKPVDPWTKQDPWSSGNSPFTSKSPLQSMADMFLDQQKELRALRAPKVPSSLEWPGPAPPGLYIEEPAASSIGSSNSDKPTSRKERKAKTPKKKKIKIPPKDMETQTDVTLRSKVDIEKWIPVFDQVDHLFVEIEAQISQCISEPENSQCKSVQISASPFPVPAQEEIPKEFDIDGLFLEEIDYDKWARQIIGIDDIETSLWQRFSPELVANPLYVPEVASKDCESSACSMADSEELPYLDFFDDECQETRAEIDPYDEFEHSIFELEEDEEEKISHPGPKIVSEHTVGFGVEHFNNIIVAMVNTCTRTSG